MKAIQLFLVVAVAAVLAAGVYGCKKKEVAPTAAMTAGTAAVATIACPKPGDDLICQDCKTLFTTPEEYRTHMEQTHPEKWGPMKEEFNKDFPPAGTATK